MLPHFRLAVACSTLLVTGCGSGSASQQQEQAARAPASTTKESADSAAYRLTGTEPFWAGELRESSFRYSTPGNVDGTLIQGRRSDLPDGRVRFTGTDEGRRFALILSRKPCSDGMSDRAYPFEAILTIDEEERHGCAARVGDPVFD